MKSYLEKRLSLVYDADAEFKTPDEEIVARLRKKLERAASIDDNKGIVHEILGNGMRQCMRRHVIDSCMKCIKLGDCRIHNLDVEIRAKGIEFAIREGVAASPRKRRRELVSAQLRRTSKK